MGEGVRQKLAELKANQPIGIEIGEINFQPEAVAAATSDFMFNLAKAVTIVFVVLLFDDGPQDRAHHRPGAVPHDHGDVPGHVPRRATCSWSGSRSGHSSSPSACSPTTRSSSSKGSRSASRPGEDKLDGRPRGGRREPVAAVRSNGHRRASPSRRSACRRTAPASTRNSLFWVILIALSLSWVSSITITPLLSNLFFKPMPSAAAGEARGSLRRALSSRAIAGCWLSGAPLSLGGGRCIGIVLFVLVAVWVHAGQAELLPAGDAAAVHGRRVPAGRHAHPRDGSLRRRGRELHPSRSQG